MGELPHIVHVCTGEKPRLEITLKSYHYQITSYEILFYYSSFSGYPKNPPPLISTDAIRKTTREISLVYSSILVYT